MRPAAAIALAVLLQSSAGVAQPLRVEQAPAIAPAPAPPVMEAPAPALPASLAEKASLLDGSYQGACSGIQVRGNGQLISYRRRMSIAQASGRVQVADHFFRSPDCSGSLYAAYQFPERSGQELGRRAAALPDSGQTVQATVMVLSQAAGPVGFLGAVMQVPGNNEMIGVVANGAMVATIALNQRLGEERLLLFAGREGLYITGSQEAGAANDNQGLPTRFVGGVGMVRVQ